MATGERAEFEAFQTELAEAMSKAPKSAGRWASDVLEMFDTEFEEQLYGEQDD